MSEKSKEICSMMAIGIVIVSFVVFVGAGYLFFK